MNKAEISKFNRYAANLNERASNTLTTLDFRRGMNLFLRGVPFQEQYPGLDGLSDARTFKVEKSSDQLVASRILREELTNASWTQEYFDQLYFQGYWGWRHAELRKTIDGMTKIERRFFSSLITESIFLANNGNASEATISALAESITGDYPETSGTKFRKLESLIGIAPQLNHQETIEGVIVNFILEWYEEKYRDRSPSIGEDTVYMSLTDYANTHGIKITYPLSIRLGGSDLDDLPPPIKN